MRLDRILQALLPHDEHFFSLFEEAARNIHAASGKLMEFSQLPSEQWSGIVDQIREYEHQGDAITHRIFSELSGTFVTPFDPEDIHVLTSALDDILDYIDGSSRRLMLYKIGTVPPEMLELMRTLHASVTEIERGVHLLRKLNKKEEMGNVIQRVNQYEDEADGIFARAIAGLFERVTDPIQIIKLKEVYVALETATDKCEDAADVLETILIKHA